MQYQIVTLNKKQQGIEGVIDRVANRNYKYLK